MRAFAILVLAMMAAVLPSCSRRSQARQDGKIGVVVSILPEAYFVEKIGGQRVHVTTLVGEGQDPHTFSPTVRQIDELSQVQVFFRIGVPFEEQMTQKLTGAMKSLKVVDTYAGIERTTDEDEPGELDPHIWVDPKLAKRQAEIIAGTLIGIDPQHKQDYQAGLAELIDELDAVDAKISAALAPLKGKTFYVFHPAFGYFAQSYGLHQKAVQTGGKDPSEKQIQDLIDQAKADGVKVIFVQPQFSDKAARTIAQQIGGVVTPVDTLSKDYLRNLEQMAEEIRASLAHN